MPSWGSLCSWYHNTLKWSTARIHSVPVKLVLQTNLHRMHGSYYVEMYKGVYKNVIVTYTYMWHMELWSAHSHHWRSIFCTAAPGLVSCHRRNNCQVSGPESDSLLHIIVWSKLLASKETEITGHKIEAIKKVVRNLPAVCHDQPQVWFVAQWFPSVWTPWKNLWTLLFLETCMMCLNLWTFAV
jgi:hypothetical protein